jgi:hypothetical protein
MGQGSFHVSKLPNHRVLYNTSQVALGGKLDFIR